LNNFYFRILSNFLGSLQNGFKWSPIKFYYRKIRSKGTKVEKTGKSALI